MRKEMLKQIGAVHGAALKFIAASLGVVFLLNGTPVLADMSPANCTGSGTLRSPAVEVTGEFTSTTERGALVTAQIVCGGNAHVEALRQLVGLWGQAEAICGEGCDRRTRRAESIIVGCNDQHSFVAQSGPERFHGVSKGLAGALFDFDCVPEPQAEKVKLPE